MRKISQDGGDSTSITSGIENEIKKPGAQIKNKKSSMKRKAKHFNHESDDAVIEPLLQKNKEKADTSNQSAKCNLLSKAKTEANSERVGDKNKLIPDNKLEKLALSDCDVTDIILPTSDMKENVWSKFTCENAPLHNHMNTNVFSGHDALKTFVAPKSQILVEIDGTKQVGYSPSPLIFTTAKIHTDGKTKHMEPVQVTSVPILSTIEVSVLKSGSKPGETSGLVNSKISTFCESIPKSNLNITETDQTLPSRTSNNTPNQPDKAIDTLILVSSNKTGVTSSTPVNNSISKETKINPAKFPLNNVSDKASKKKCVTTENTLDKGEYTKKNLVSKCSTSSTTEKTKTVIPSEIVYPVTFTPATTKSTSVNNSTKGSYVTEQAVAVAKNKTDASIYPEKKIDLNENVKSGNMNSQQTKASDPLILQNSGMNTSDNTSWNKTVTNTNTSLSGRQLQRQNTVKDDDDPILKLKSSIGLSSLTNDPKSLCLSDKNKLPNPSAHSILITSASTVPNTTSPAVIKSFAPITAAAAVNNKSVPFDSAGINKIFAPISNINAVSKTSVSITNTAAINKRSTSITASTAANTSFAPTNTAAIAGNIKCAPATTTVAVSKKSTSITTTAVVSKSSDLITTSAAVNKTFVPITTHSTANKSFIPVTTLIPTNKMNVPFTTTAAVNNFSTPVTKTVSVNKTSTSDSISSVETNTISACSLLNSSNKPITKSVVATTSLASEAMSTGKQSVANAVISGSTVKTETISATSTIKPPITSTKNTKPSGSTISANSTKASTVLTPNTTSQQISVVMAPIITKTANARTIPQATVGKLSEYTTNNSTSYAKPSTAQSNSTYVSSAAIATHVTSSFTPATTTTSTSATSGSSSKSSISNKPSDSKSNDTINDSKSFKA